MRQRGRTVPAYEAIAMRLGGPGAVARHRPPRQPAGDRRGRDRQRARLVDAVGRVSRPDRRLGRGDPRARASAATTVVFVAATPGPRRADDRAPRRLRAARARSAEADDLATPRCSSTTGQLSRGFHLPAANLLLFAETDLFEEERRVHERRRSAEPLVHVRLPRFEDRRPRRARGQRHRPVRRAEEARRRAGPAARRSSWSSATPARTSSSSRSKRLDLVQKYTGGAAPALDKLGGTTWEKAKTRVKKAMRDMAEELLKLYAARKAVAGHAFSPDSHWQQEFADAFEYELTADQQIGDRRHHARHGVADADGSPALRRRRLRQDRSRDARGVQGRDGRQAGRVSRADDRARVPALAHAERAVCRLPGPHRHDQPLPDASRNRRSCSSSSPPARSTSSSARTGCCRRTCSSAISDCWWWTRNSDSASRTRNGSSSCARRSTC